MKSTKTGVPQESNLSPLLCLIYINDLPNCLSDSTPVLFADDTNVIVTGTSSLDIEEKLNRELNNLHSWILADRLPLIVGKTENTIIRSTQRMSRMIETDPRVSINNQGIGVLRRVKDVISVESLENLYKALVLPHFDYCSLLWNNCANELKARI